jgi:antitoxin (DNA-binding transcriptional repressor) of toxin-antitoxin stability system
MKVSVANAKNKLPELIKAVEGGESVTICRRGVPVADLVRTNKGSGQRPKLGSLRGKFVFNDADWWKPMTESEAEDFLAGR